MTRCPYCKQWSDEEGVIDHDPLCPEAQKEDCADTRYSVTSVTPLF